MLQLDTDEKIIATIHRHWFVISGKLSLLAVLLLPPIIILSLMGALVPPEYTTFALFLTMIYINIILLFGFIVWTDFYLDIWIITTRRILDIEQRGLFNRSVSEFLLSNIQDISISIPDFFATIFKYGDIVVQTAGEKSFSIDNTPHPEQTKDLIMRCHDEARPPKTISTDQNK